VVMVRLGLRVRVRIWDLGLKSGKGTSLTTTGIRVRVRFGLKLGLKLGLELGLGLAPGFSLGLRLGRAIVMVRARKHLRPQGHNCRQRGFLRRQRRLQQPHES
jgi:hypothetical protein